MKATGDRTCRHPRRESRKKFALEYQEARAKLTPQQQLEVLDLRLGKNVGAIKERARLLKQIAEK